MPPEHWWTASRSHVSEILSVLAGAPDSPAAHWRGEVFTGGDLLRSVTDAFHALRECGVGKGHVVAILVAANSPEMLTVRYATHLLGGAVCYLRTSNPGTRSTVLPLDDQVRVLHETGATAVYADAGNSRRAGELADSVGGLEVVRPRPADRDGAGRADVAPWDPDALAAVTFTSGSTGRPKGIRMANRAWECAVQAFVTVGRNVDCATMLVSTPLSHSVAPIADATLALGGAVHLQENYSAEELVKIVSEGDVTWTYMATTHVFQLIDHLHEQGISDVAASGLSSLKRIFYSGSPAAPARIAQAFALFGPVLAQGYGSMETGRITYLMPDEHGDPALATTVGRPHPQVEAVVCDPDSGAPLEAGQIGELRVRSPQMMDGYTGDPDLTTRVLRDGWYFTGDIGFFDDDGYLHLTSRVAEVIKVDGVKVHPIVVEGEILSHPGVRHAAVYGVQDADGTEHVHAAIECDPDAPIDVGHIRARIARSLSVIHVPEQIDVLSALPLNANGKPDKVLLRSQHA
ncbi:class I adenylate-forming enzyme family protein [Lentzea californiensis]|uniref:class I adenylate-forming enzyme family protein n=1 Tax=Lentzea californiensis TaxID=438851 RepID=UPI0021666AFF|nr:AMP-binding protein [Lentzea californiensis]MCR3752115.1 fatty-acyl-CoA synthase [Lentzea californiensis]